MFKRHLGDKILRDLKCSPVVGIVGSRQVGKTTLAKHLQSNISKETLYLDLELQSDWQKLEDAERYLKRHEDKCIIIDEVQLKPTVFPLLRALVDQKREPARFILLGSASPSIVKENTETLAGRIAYHELGPFSWSEVQNITDMETHHLRGGFPEALLPTSDIQSRKWRDDFRETFIHRDLGRLGYDIPPRVLGNFLSMLSHVHGNLLNVSMLSKSLGVSRPAVVKYLEILEGGFLLRRLQPYFINIGKRLIKSPKVYIRDSGLLHSLLRVYDYEQLLGMPQVGASWEGYVIEQIILEAPEFSDFFFYRTGAGAEVDLVMITPSGKRICIEIKNSISPRTTKGLHQSINDLEPVKSFIITPGGEYYEKGENLWVCPLDVFLAGELGKLE
ncbi:MAG: ATP-binding protein [Bacteroidia bacterium]